MNKISKFEDLYVWQKARILVNDIYKLTIKFPKEERFNLIDQIRRAVVSILANIAEGFSRYHVAETMQFYRNARGSLSEVKCLLYISKDQNYISENDLKIMFGEIDEIGKMLNGLINTTKSFRNTKL